MPQVLGNIALIPLTRETADTGLRLALRNYEQHAPYTPDNVEKPDNTNYYSYIPHALIATPGGKSEAAFGTRILRSAKCNSDPPYGLYGNSIALHKVARRESPDTLRLLPLHTAMEGFLSLHFGGPDIAWSEYTHSVKDTGLGFRTEHSVSGRYISGLQDALRVFEIQHRQCGVILMVANAVAAIFITPHPEDYRSLHQTLLQDFYGELVYHYGLMSDAPLSLVDPIPEQATDFDQLRDALKRMRTQWQSIYQRQLTSLFDTPITAKKLYQFGPYTLQQFSTGFNPNKENHIGECIVNSNQHILYLKTYRLSASQCRRAYLLQQLAENDWHLDRCAIATGCQSTNELILRMQNAGFGYLLHPHILDAARAWRRKR
ncbi:hypothetical protein AB833_03485 [Chromatiales bacterium (ex Bugula neritina AB1)]|nr:hypothetical protein AB833_03485 [Chromatiales bacterium (ex Bugula neritina AB1)]